MKEENQKNGIDEKIFLEKMLNLEDFAKSANAEDLSLELLSQLLKEGVQKALAKYPEATTDNPVIDFYIVQTIRKYKANLPESYALRIKIEEKNKGF